MLRLLGSKGWKRATPPLGSARRNSLSFSPAAVRSYRTDGSRADGSGPDFILSPGGWRLMGIVYVLGQLGKVVYGIKLDKEFEKERIEREAAMMNEKLEREKAWEREKARLDMEFQ